MKNPPTAVGGIQDHLILQFIHSFYRSRFRIECDRYHQLSSHRSFGAVSQRTLETPTLVWPLPMANLRHVVTILDNVLLMVPEPISHLL